MDDARAILRSSIAPSPAEPVPDGFDLVCEHCGYSLVGLLENRCPECGEAFNPTLLPLARVPWLYRKQHGPIRAYIMTVWMIVRRPAAFAREIARPVRICADDAKRFRRTTIRLTLLVALLFSVALATLQIAYFYLMAGLWPMRGWVQNVQVFSSIPLGLAALWVFLWLASDLPTFIWRGLPANPHDLAPLHHYAIGPLGAAPMFFMVIAAAAAIGGLESGWTAAFIVVEIAVAVVLLLLALMMWRVPVVMMRAATDCTRRRQLLLGLYLPFHWGLMALGSFLVFGALTAALGAVLGNN